MQVLNHFIVLSLAFLSVSPCPSLSISMRSAKTDMSTITVDASRSLLLQTYIICVIVSEINGLGELLSCVNNYLNCVICPSELYQLRLLVLGSVVLFLPVKR